MQHEPFGGFGVDHLASRGQRGRQRAHDEIEDLILEDEGDQKSDKKADERPDDPFPELIEVLEKRHLGTGSVEVGFLLVGIDRCPGGVLGAGERYERHGNAIRRWCRLSARLVPRAPPWPRASLRVERRPGPDGSAARRGALRPRACCATRSTLS